jgi:hypothetical protein
MRAIFGGSSKHSLIACTVSVSILVLGGAAYGISTIGSHPSATEVGDRLLTGRAGAVQNAEQPEEAQTSAATPEPVDQAGRPVAAEPAPVPTRSQSSGSQSSGSSSAQQAPPLPPGELGNFGSGGAGFQCHPAKTMFAGSNQDVDCFGFGHQGFVGEVRLSCTAPAGMTCEVSKDVVSPPQQFNGETKSVPVTVRVFIPKGFSPGQHIVKLHYDAPAADPRIPHTESELRIHVVDTSYFANCGPLSLAAGAEGEANCLIMIPAGSYQGPIYLSVQTLTPGGPQPMLATKTVSGGGSIQVPVRFHADASVAPGRYTYELGTTHIEGGPSEPHKPGAPMMTNRFNVTVTP